MDSDVYELVQRIHQTDCSCVVAVTGGGATAVSWLLAVPGASRTILEAQVPYSPVAFRQLIGKAPDGFCTEQAGVALAEAAWSRALLLRGAGRCLGLGCTASLASDRPKRGEHRFFAAAAAEDTVTTASLVFEKGARSRGEEEEIVSRAIINLVAGSTGLKEKLPLSLRPGESSESKSFDRGSLLAKFLRGQTRRLCVLPDGRLSGDAASPSALLSGSFNPLHKGHCQLARAAGDRLQSQVSFELSVTNVDKPALELGEIRRRAGQFHGRASVWLTHAPTFVEKAGLFPGCVFVVGVDTAVRIVQHQYYVGGQAGMNRAAETIRSQGCRFLVAARSSGQGQLLGMEDVAVPASFAGLFKGIPKDIFNVPISSTELRKRLHSGSGEVVS